MTDSAIGVHGPERDVANDMVRLAMVLGPILIAVSGIFWGFGGLASSALAFAIVVANLYIGAWIIGRFAAISPQMLMVGVLVGFALRLIALTVIVFPLRNASWFEIAPFAISLVGGHLGLLLWETQRVSLSFAYPGVDPEIRPPLSSLFSSDRTRSRSDR